MLARANRLTSSRDFAACVRGGRRSGTRTMVLHLSESSPPAQPPRVGVIVGRAVGSAVTRNRVKRRLKHLARQHLASLPGSAVLVVRANPASGQAPYLMLADDFERSLGRVLRDAGPVAAGGAG